MLMVHGWYDQYQVVGFSTYPSWFGDFIPVATPPERTTFIESEERTSLILPEDRTTVIEYEDREVVIV